MAGAAAEGPSAGLQADMGRGVLRRAASEGAPVAVGSQGRWTRAIDLVNAAAGFRKLASDLANRERLARALSRTPRVSVDEKPEATTNEPSARPQSSGSGAVRQSGQWARAFKLVLAAEDIRKAARDLVEREREELRQLRKEKQKGKGEVWKAAANDLDDSTGLSPLHMACKEGDAEAVQILMKSEGVSPSEPASAERDSICPLHLAAAGGHIKCVEALLAAGAAPGATDAHGRTALHAAAERCGAHADATAFTSAHTPRARTTRMDSGFDTASIASTPKATTSSAGAGLSARCVQAAEMILKTAAKESQEASATLARAATSDRAGRRTAMHEAARNGCEPMVRLLASAVGGASSGASADGSDDADAGASAALLGVGDARGRTPLHDAARKGHAAAVAALVELGAPLGARDDPGDNVLHLAAAAGMVRPLRGAIERRAARAVVDDGAAASNKGSAAAEADWSSGGGEQVSDGGGGMKGRGAEAVLSAAAGAACALGADGATPLHIAVVAGDVQAAEDLVVLGGLGALVVPDTNNRTPNELAKELARSHACTRVTDPARARRLEVADRAIEVHRALVEHRMRFARAIAAGRDGGEDESPTSYPSPTRRLTLGSGVTRSLGLTTRGSGVTGSFGGSVSSSVLLGARATEKLGKLAM